MNKIELDQRATVIGLSHVTSNSDDLLASGMTTAEIINMIETDNRDVVGISHPFVCMHSGDILSEAADIKEDVINIVNEATKEDKDVLLYAREMLESFKPEALVEMGLNVLLEKVVAATYADETFVKEAA